MPRLHLRLLRDGATVNDEQIDPAVVVVIEKRRARSHRLDEVFLGTRPVHVSKGDANGFRHILERHVRLRAQRDDREQNRRADECRPHLPFSTSSIFCWLSRN
jgi:hypothetical protein